MASEAARLIGKRGKKGTDHDYCRLMGQPAFAVFTLRPGASATSFFEPTVAQYIVALRGVSNFVYHIVIYI